MCMAYCPIGEVAHILHSALTLREGEVRNILLATMVLLMLSGECC
jgi:hypothetical protein